MIKVASTYNTDLGRALTDRENEIVQLVSEGLKNREIAARLFITEKTVKNHIRHIFDKIGARQRADIVIYYYAKGGQLNEQAEHRPINKDCN